jgi:hypothetical protein
MEADYRVHLANPAAMQQYSGLKYTDDHSDARWLAHLLRLGVLPEGYIYPKAERAVRDLWLSAIIWAESKSLHNRPISFFSDCVHFAIQRPGVESA